MSKTARKPYKGLVPYAEEDWPFFFGREIEREIITNNLLASRLTLLYGPSGVGKSSVLRAGAAHYLRELAKRNKRETGTPDIAVVVLRDWQDDPIAKLPELIEQAVSEASDREFEPLPPNRSLTEVLAAWGERLDGDLLIILDQFEEYFVHRGEENGPGTFTAEFPRAVKNLNLHVRFLISIREDALAKLDRFKNHIPNLFSNSIRVKHLDREAARAAIVKPIDKYNDLYAADGQQFEVESSLVDAVLDQIGVGNDDEAGAVKGDEKIEPQTEAGIETPYLQLVMDRLWDEENKAASLVLRLDTLTRMGGAKSIVQEHVRHRMKELSLRERTIAAKAFRFLIGPSGDRQTYTATDLAERAELKEDKLSRLLEKLTGEGYRILHSSDPPGSNGNIPAAPTPKATRYEISHDMLGKPIEDWRKRYAEKAKGIKRLLLFAIAMVVVFALAGEEYVRITYQKEQEKERLLQQQEKLRAVVAANANSQILAQLYQAIFGRGDPKQAEDNLQPTLSLLNKAINEYRQDNNKIGEGITLNNIAGIHRFLGEENRNYGSHEQAENYYDQARDEHRLALGLLEDSLGQDSSEVANSLNDLAYIYILEGKYAEAEPLFDRARKILEQSLKPDDRYLADSLRNLAECYYREGKFDQAQPLYNRALEIRRADLEPGDPELTQAYYDLALIYFEQGKYAEGEPLFDEALKIQKATTDLANRLNRLACLLYWQRNYSKAEQRFNEALDIWENASDQQALGIAISLNGLAAVYRKQGANAEAQQYLEYARAYEQEVAKQNSYSTVYDLYRLALLYDDLNKAETESVFNRVISIWENSLGRKHPDTAAGLSSLAFFYYKRGMLDKAAPLFDEARGIQEALPDSPYLAKTIYGLARLYTDQGKYAEAEPLFTQALTIQKKAIADLLDTADTLNAYADLLRKTNRDGEAAQMEERAKRIRDRQEKEN